MNTENSKDILLLAEQIINQTHYNNLSDLKITELDENSRSINAENVLCLFKISEIVYDENETTNDKFSVVFNALHCCGASCIMILECIEGRTDLYLGAINKQRYENLNYLSVIRDILKTSIQGNLPGSEINEVISRQDIKKVLHNALNNGFESQCITSVSCVAGSSGSPACSEHGLEALLGAVRESNFSIIVIADPVSDEQIDAVKKGYEDLGTNLSAFENTSMTVQSGNNYTTSETTSTSFNESINQGISLTQSHNVSGTYKKEKSQKEQQEESGKSILKLGIGAATLAATGGNMGASYIAMNAAEQLLKGRGGKSSKEETSLVIKEDNFGLTKIQHEQGLVRTDSNANYSLSPESITSGNSEQTGVNMGRSHGKTEQTGSGSSFTQVESTSIQKTTKDLHISELNNKLLRYLSWLNRSKNYGMFNCCTYIISGSASTNLFVAGQYQALIQSHGENEQPISINTWTKENGVEEIRNSLLHLIHPSFESDTTDNIFTSAMLLSSNELSKQMSLPKKSILGVSVTNHAPFGIEVVRKSALTSGALVRVGEIYHMGRKTLQPVLLSLQTLAAHTFISGTNGSGKSNTVFRIIEELMRNKIPFMVIEPAKGEYKNLFGNDPGVTVYGTNPKKSKLLSINPFRFNDEVTVREHIDYLLSIFNASWSMTAAMPEILKASIENAYKACGWNLKASECLGKKKFPTAKTVLNEFKKKLKSTEFSAEVKGNYVGALTARMESLCNGIYEDIFSEEDMGDEALFDSNVIIDLSRVGSSETKALIMGFLIVRLQEYRMKNEALNLPLQHITILEEAHHLLRRTASAQSDEGRNLLGKSVEMIATMISEMRSFGEGFMIVDQSPGLLDMSVIRNTNTKIIMRLLESSDRELVGNTIGLNQKQKTELSKLNTGICAIYQQGWLDPVLCAVDKAYHEASIYKYTPCVNLTENALEIKKARGIAFDTIMHMNADESYNENMISSAVKTLETAGSPDKKLSALLTEHFNSKQRRQKEHIEPYASIIWDLLDGDNIWYYLYNLITSEKFSEFDSLMREQIDKIISCSEDTRTSIISLFLQKKGVDTCVYNFHRKWAWKYMYDNKNDIGQ